MKDFSFQGKIYIGLRADDGTPLALRWVDDASQLQLQLSTDTSERQESYSGNRLTSVRLQKGIKAEFSLTLNAFSKKNLALALFGEAKDVADGSVTAEAFPDDLAAGDIIALDHRDVSDVEINDSDGTPKSLTKDTDYAIESAEGGLIKILAPDSYKQPFTADYSYAASVNVPMFTTGAPERYILLDGINTVDQSRARVRLYRAAFDPANQVDLISDDLGSLELKGGILHDAVNAADESLGGFGRIELPDDSG